MMPFSQAVFRATLELQSRWEFYSEFLFYIILEKAFERLVFFSFRHTASEAKRLSVELDMNPRHSIFIEPIIPNDRGIPDAGEVNAFALLPHL